MTQYSSRNMRGHVGTLSCGDELDVFPSMTATTETGQRASGVIPTKALRCLSCWESGGGSGSRLPAAQRKFKIKRRDTTCVILNGSGIQLAVGTQPLWLRNHNSGLAQRIMVKRLATSPHDPLGITDSACKNQLVVVSVQYGPFNPYISIRPTTIGKSRVAKDPIAMHTSWRSNSDITSATR
ncbi:exportin-1-like [Dorcoceras hygrometricum]|uniref:Exportin-1-like n=1 Tax=Dorcoceras hygrometricum TaxID=472368 RepID=A0A2Z7BU17_9LAMI|nr:exportin-1-like [Dorcoceras hygrometricum]